MTSATKYDASIASEIISRFGAKPEMLVQILHAFVERYGFIGDDGIRQIAGELNLSRAEVHGVVSFYHDFRTTPPGRHTIKICQSEACQAMGSRELTAHALSRLGVGIGETTADGRISLEPVYCTGSYPFGSGFCLCSGSNDRGQRPWPCRQRQVRFPDRTLRR